MKLKKIVFLLIGAYVLFTSFEHAFAVPVTDAAAYKADIIKVTDIDIEEAYTDLTVTGRLPFVEIMGEDDSEPNADDFSRELNRAVNNIQEEKTQEAQRGRITLLNFDYEVKKENDFVFILIKTTYTRGTTKNEIDTVNFHITSEKLLTITDILGPNGVNIANRIISETIKKIPKNTTQIIRI